MSKKLHLYFDDTGSRDPDRVSSPDAKRRDGMDCFGLGGVLIREEDIDGVFAAHKAFCADWEIDYPLHSSKIRGGQGKFGWLKKPDNAASFLPALEDYLLSLPIISIACAVHRPGYVHRYKDRYQERLWFMCKTAYSILIERAAKYADSEGRKLEVFFEMTGRKEDKDIAQYTKELKKTGPPFATGTSEAYTPFTASDFRRIVLGEPRQRTKKTPMIQIADLVLYPMAKGRYDPTYRPYVRLSDGGKLIDCYLAEDERPLRGIKYSCFDDVAPPKE
ncbi:MAG: DUF3800 domain-containing protein [Phyllobacteriaceae bacterium]|jgi:hypothetical protein|nr:DUF3800 domain-containing protein [Phyllobacteriaceae bacterium]